MLGLLNIARAAERPHQSLSDFGVFSARPNRLIRDRPRAGLCSDGRRCSGWPKRLVLPTGHRFANFAGEDFSLRADYYLQDIATWTNHAPRAQASKRRLVNQSIVHHFEAQARRAGVHEFKISIATQRSHIADRAGKSSRRTRRRLRLRQEREYLRQKARRQHLRAPALPD